MALNDYVTVDEFIAYPHNRIFKTGDAFLSGGFHIKYVCVKGNGHDWACYYLPFKIADTAEYIARYGNKMTDLIEVRRATGLTDLLRFYRR